MPPMGQRGNGRGVTPAPAKKASLAHRPERPVVNREAGGSTPPAGSLGKNPDGKYKVNPDLLPLLRPLGSVKRDPDNARLHPVINLEGIKGSYVQFGQQKAIVVSKDHIIVAGSGQHEAAEALGWTHLAMVTFPGTAREAEAYGITDNETGLTSTWDWPRLSVKLKKLSEFKWEALGWPASDLAPLLAGTWEKPALGDLGGEGDAHPRTIKVTGEQWEVIVQAIAKVRDGETDPTMSDGRCLELVCADFIA